MSPLRIFIELLETVKMSKRLSCNEAEKGRFKNNNSSTCDKKVRK